jgi:flagellar biosynthetic protein FliR
VQAPVYTVNLADLSQTVLRMWWPVLRIGGFIAAAPVTTSASVPTRIKLALSISLVVLVAPLAPTPPQLTIFSSAGFLAAGQELLIGVAIGMVVQVAFEALTLAGQTIAMTMGLGFATMIDPERGASTTVVGQMFMIFATLVYLAINGHLVLIATLADSFRTIPIGAATVGHDFLWSVAVWGGHVFEAGLSIALPAVVALVIVNFAMGVVTRAAPQLNLFGVGFPITMLAGFFVLVVGMDGVLAGIQTLVQHALSVAAQLVAPAPAPVPVP